MLQGVCIQTLDKARFFDSDPQEAGRPLYLFFSFFFFNSEMEKPGVRLFAMAVAHASKRDKKRYYICIQQTQSSRSNPAKTASSRPA
jgi:hypothetical protein